MGCNISDSTAASICFSASDAPAVLPALVNLIIESRGWADETAFVSAEVPWPDSLLAQMQALRSGLTSLGILLHAGQLARHFAGASEREVKLLLDALVELGVLHMDEMGRFGT